MSHAAIIHRRRCFCDSIVFFNLLYVNSNFCFRNVVYCNSITDPENQYAARFAKPGTHGLSLRHCPNDGADGNTAVPGHPAISSIILGSCRQALNPFCAARARRLWFLTRFTRFLPSPAPSPAARGPVFDDKPTDVRKSYFAISASRLSCSADRGREAEYGRFTAGITIPFCAPLAPTSLQLSVLCPRSAVSCHNVLGVCTSTKYSKQDSQGGLCFEPIGPSP